MVHAFYFNTPLEKNWWGHIFSEIYKDKIFAPFVEGKKDLTIIDIGANLGLTSYYFSQFAKQVYSLEPAVSHFNLLTRMIKFNEIKNIKAIPKAIWLENTKLPFFHNDNRTMYSLHMAVDDKSSPPEEVETITFDKLFEDEKIDHANLVKVDVEGSEMEILASEGFAKVAPKIDTIVVEYHSWSQRHPNQLNDALKGNGFEVSTIPSSAEIIVGRRKQ